MTVAEDLNVLFSAEREGQKLTETLVAHIVKYLVEEVKITNVKEVDLENTVNIAEEAWESAETAPLPGMLLRCVKNWVTPPPPKAQVRLSAMQSGNVNVEVPTEEADDGEDLFGAKGPSQREVAQLMEDTAAQNLIGAQIVQLSLALELGTVPVMADVLGKVRYGSDPKVSEEVKRHRKAGCTTRQSVLDGPNPLRELASFFTQLVREYGEEGGIQQASLLTAWWAETQGICTTDRMLVAYLKEYFRKYAGRGLPTKVDILLVTRVSGSQFDVGPMAEALKEAKEAAKAAKTEVASLKSEVGSMKAEMARLKTSFSGLRTQGGPPATGNKDKNMVCHICGEKGHRAANCPTKEKGGPKAEGEGDEE